MLKPLNETSYPFLVIARKYDVGYNEVLIFADDLENYVNQVVGTDGKIRIRNYTKINSIPGMYGDVTVALRKHGRIR